MLYDLNHLAVWIVQRFVCTVSVAARKGAVFTCRLPCMWVEPLFFDRKYGVCIFLRKMHVALLLGSNHYFYKSHVYSNHVM
jgi:hypothetical protein